MAPVLFCAPVFWTQEFWTESTHAWDWVEAETPLEEKPWAELEVSLDVTLEEVFETACDAWGITAGPELFEYGGTRAKQFVRFAFVRPDQDGVDAHEGYGWPSALPVARENGTVELVPGLEITYRELLVASSLGLLEGDVKRPYVHPVIPGGDPGQVIEAARFTLEAIRAAYGAADDAVGYADHTIQLIRASAPKVHRVADQVVDEGVRVGAVLGFLAWLRRKIRRRRSRHNRDEKSGERRPRH